MALKLAVILSGSGSTLQNILDRIDDGQLDASVSCVVSSRSDAYGLERAEHAGIPKAVVARKDHADTATFGEAIWQVIDPYKVDLVVMAGFMCLLPVPESYTNRIINVHPALIPAFCGKGMYGSHVHEAVIESGVKETGVTVHFVDNVYDHGPIIVQRTVPVLDDDTVDTLQARVQAEEREAYPEAIQLIADGRLTVENHRVRVRAAGA